MRGWANMQTPAVTKNHMIDPFDEVFAGGERVEQAKCGVQPERQKRGGQAEGDQRTGSQHLEGVRGGSDGERGDDEREYRGE